MSIDRVGVVICGDSLGRIIGCHHRSASRLKRTPWRGRPIDPFRRALSIELTSAFPFGGRAPISGFRCSVGIRSDSVPLLSRVPETRLKGSAGCLGGEMTPGA
jgi:hypothetical protein